MFRGTLLKCCVSEILRYREYVLISWTDVLFYSTPKFGANQILPSWHNYMVQPAVTPVRPAACHGHNKRVDNPVINSRLFTLEKVIRLHAISCHYRAISAYPNPYVMRILQASLPASRHTTKYLFFCSLSQP